MLYTLSASLFLAGYLLAVSSVWGGIALFATSAISLAMYEDMRDE